MFVDMQTPSEIEICPIIDSVLEFRFSSHIYSNAVFGVIFNLLKDDFPSVEKLPILQLPEQLRDSDPNLKDKPNYRLLSPDGYSIKLGPNVLIFGAPTPYPGWANFSQRFFDVCSKISGAGVINQITRLGVRYINFFELDIFEHIEVEVSINKKQIKPFNTLIRTQIEDETFQSTLQVANNVSHVSKDVPKTGSILDIDTFKVFDNMTLGEEFNKQVESAHEKEKNLFFSLINDAFLDTLKPTYK